jgi:hypothetical protein
MKAAELYDLDFAEWARENAELLRSGRVAEADLEHIAEEIEDMGKRERRSLYTRCVRLIEHLLKWQHQPERRGRSWLQTIYLQRKGIRRLLKENPSLTPHMVELVAEAYEEAAGSAAIVTGLTLNEFPSACPWTVDQLLDDGFLP